MLKLNDLAIRPDFAFGPLTLSPSRRTVEGPGGTRHIEPLIMQVFLLLIDADGQVVTRDQLFNECWGGTVVGDDSLNRAIAKARRVTSEVAPRMIDIQTIPRTGYRLGVTETAEPPMIAVLPFSNRGSDPDYDFFVEGMSDEIVTALTRIRTLLVISSQSSAAFKNGGREDQHVAAQMGIRYFLSGSVRRSDSQVRISAKLVDIDRHVQIWAESYDYHVKDVFELQDRIAVAVATAIEPSVNQAEIRRVARQPIENLGCYDLHLRAAPLRATCRQLELMQALELLDRALALDASFAPALAQAAGCHSQMYVNAWGEEPEWHRTQGLILADRALMNGAEDASVLAQVANALMDLEGSVVRAIALADRAVTLAPGLARAWFISGLTHLLDHDPHIAVAHLENAARLDPISPLNDVIRAHIGVGQFLKGDYKAALDAILETRHRTVRIHLMLAAIYGYLDMPRESQEEIVRFQNSSPQSVEEVIVNGMPHEKSRVLFRNGIELGRRAIRPH